MSGTDFANAAKPIIRNQPQATDKKISKSCASMKQYKDKGHFYKYIVCDAGLPVTSQATEAGSLARKGVSVEYNRNAVMRPE